MFSFLRNLFWPPRRQPEAEGSQSLMTENNRKRRPPRAEEEESINIKKARGSSSYSRISWNLDLEQADYRFSQETLSIFKGTGKTVLVCKPANQSHGTFRSYRVASTSVATSSSLSIFAEAAAAAAAAAAVASPSGLPVGSPRWPAETAGAATLGRSAFGCLRETTNVLSFHSPAPARPAAAVARHCLHSTPLMDSSRGPAAAPVSDASTVPKRPAGGSRASRDDEDCVITRVEGPKSVAEIFSPCKYLSSDWLADIKTSSHSLKSYMQKVETEESLKMQYWAKRRESDERDLVARVTRNLKLAERELPVVPYKYEEPPPTPPPSPPPPEIIEVEAKQGTVETEPEFPDLSESQLRLVEGAWSRQLPGGEVLAEGFSLRVTREELRSLSGLNWLNDNVVNFYMQLIVNRTGPGLPTVHAFSTFFFTKLSSSGYASVRRWTKRVDIFDKDVLLCPIHLHNNHWTLCIIDMRARHILYLDSIARGGDPSCLPLLRQYLAEEHRDKKGGNLEDANEFQLVREMSAPQQENGSDCGVFCCKFADYYCKGREFSFGQRQMQYFRKRTTVEILEKRLLW